MEYIRSSADEAMPKGCVFCRIREGHEAEHVLARSDLAFVVLNKFPYNPGHAIVAPEAHVPGLEVLDDEQTTHLMRALRRTIDVLRSTLQPEGFNIGANIGRAAGAGIPDHVHLHVVPRWNGDTNFMAVIDDVKVVNEALAQTAAKLKEAFAKS